MEALLLSRPGPSCCDSLAHCSPTPYGGICFQIELGLLELFPGLCGKGRYSSGCSDSVDSLAGACKTAALLQSPE